MKAAVVCANEDVQYLDYEEPTPGPGEVKVKVKASGICGSDIPRVLYNGVHFIRSCSDMSFPETWWKSGKGLQR